MEYVVNIATAGGKHWGKVILQADGYDADGIAAKKARLLYDNLPGMVITLQKWTSPTGTNIAFNSYQPTR